MVYYPFDIFFKFLKIFITPCSARSKKDIGIIDLIINLYGNPPGSGLDSRIDNESSTNGNEV